MRPPRKEAPGSLLLIDAATRANLELHAVQTGAPAQAACSPPSTARRHRRRRARACKPPRQPAHRCRRRSTTASTRVSYLAGEPRLRQTLRDELKRAPDLARRAGAACAQPRRSARSRRRARRPSPRPARSPRILAACRRRLGLPQELDAVAARLRSVPEDVERDPLRAALADELPPSTSATAASSATASIAISTSIAACATAAARSSPGCRRATPTTTGIKSLKVRHNNVLGYFVEVTAQQWRCARQAAACRDCSSHRQTLANVSALLHARAWRARSAHHHRRRPRARASSSRSSPSSPEARARRAGARLPRRAPASPSSTTMPASPSLRSSRNYARPKVDDSLAHLPWSKGRHPMVEQNLRATATAPTLSAMIAGSRAENKDTGTPHPGW